MTAECLKRIDREATLAYEREHVTVRVREHLDDYRAADLCMIATSSWMRLTVDIPKDLDRIARLLAALPVDRRPALRAVVGGVRARPVLVTGRSVPLARRAVLECSVTRPGKCPIGSSRPAHDWPGGSVAHGRRVSATHCFTGAVGVFSLSPTSS